MKTYARIQDGVVVELFETDGDITTMFHPDLEWVEITGLDPQPQVGWTYDGEGFAQPEPVAPEPYVPQQVTRAQGKAALIAAGLWSAVESFVDSIGDPTEKAMALVALNDTTHWNRTSPFLNAAAAALGLTEQQLDDLFIQAATIEL